MISDDESNRLGSTYSPHIDLFDEFMGHPGVSRALLLNVLLAL
jgi:hypothetical protein